MTKREVFPINAKIKEELIEKYEVLGRAADDITYILADKDSLTVEELDYKIMARTKRIESELKAIVEIMLNY